MEDSIALAADAHKGQVDKIGQPYIFHPLRVMLEMTTLEDRTVGVLHDVLEDTDLTPEALLAEGYPIWIVDAILAISRKDDDEEWMDFISRASEDPIALRVKLADIRDNMSPARLYRLEPEVRDRLKKKYYEAVKYLEGKAHA